MLSVHDTRVVLSDESNFESVRGMHRMGLNPPPADDFYQVNQKCSPVDEAETFPSLVSFSPYRAIQKASDTIPKGFRWYHLFCFFGHIKSSLDFITSVMIMMMISHTVAVQTSCLHLGAAWTHLLYSFLSTNVQS